jgi:uncharacterized membrane protein
MLRERTHDRRRQARKGIALLLSALLLGILIAFVGLAVDLGVWVSQRSELQTAADLAALAGAQDLSRDAAQASAELNGIALEETRVTVDGDRVEVEIRHEAPSYFSRIIGQREMTLTVRATATQTGGLLE